MCPGRERPSFGWVASFKLAAPHRTSELLVRDYSTALLLNTLSLQLSRIVVQNDELFKSIAAIREFSKSTDEHVNELVTAGVYINNKLVKPVPVAVVVPTEDQQQFSVALEEHQSLRSETSEASDISLLSMSEGVLADEQQQQ